MKKMNPEWKAKWIEALRSGAYPQAREALRMVDFGPDGSERVEGYCCLGVLQDLVTGDFSNCPKSGYMNPKVSRIVGIPYPSSSFKDLRSPRNAQRRLANMNDSGGMSFAEIADWIEENL